MARQRSHRIEFKRQVNAMTALPPIADIAGWFFDVRFVPEADIA